MITDKYFIDWHSDVFGFGYGTGEEYTLPALKRFLELCWNKDTQTSTYNHEIIEKELTPTVAWLLINILCNDDMIEYGTSPRYGWLTEKGNLLKEYISSKSVDNLYDTVSVDSTEYIHCMRDYCNCENNCKNPLFK